MFKDLVNDTPSYEIFNFFSNQEISMLLDIFRSSPNDLLQISKLTNFEHPWIRLNKIKSIPEIKNIFQRIKNTLQVEMELIGDNFYQTPSAYGIHTDAKFGIKYNKLIPFKNFLIPLYPDNNKIKFFTFNQRYYGNASSFLYGDNNREKLQYNQQIYPPYHVNSAFLGSENNKITKQWWVENINLPGIPYENFKELSIEKEFIFQPGTLIVFDSWRLHCAGNFLQLGIPFKIGLSLVGMKKDESIL